MADDKNTTDTSKDTAKTTPAAQGLPGTTTQPSSTNLNGSPSPGGDGVQSSSSEKAAAGQTGNSQGAQNRINAAERREKLESGENKGEGPFGIVQSPGIVEPADHITAAEEARKAAYERDRALEHGNVPQATLDEIEAGKKALERSSEARNRELRPASDRCENPVDALNDKSKG